MRGPLNQICGGLLAGILICWPTLGWGAAEQQDAAVAATYKDGRDMKDQFQHLGFRCLTDPNDLFDSSDFRGTVSQGAVCEAGDWTMPLDCRGTSILTVMYWDYSADPNGSEVIVWNCVVPLGAAGTEYAADSRLPDIDPPGDPNAHAPSTAPSAADPDPLCVDVTSTVYFNDPNGLDGLNNKMFSVPGTLWQWIIVEFDAITATSSEVHVLCGPS